MNFHNSKWLKELENHFSPKHYFRSHFAHSPPTDAAYVEQPQKSNEEFVRNIAIMHDKLNDAVEIVNYSFSYEVNALTHASSSTSIATKDYQIHFYIYVYAYISVATRDGLYTFYSSFHMFYHFSDSVSKWGQCYHYGRFEFDLGNVSYNLFNSCNLFWWHSNEGCKCFMLLFLI